MVDLEYAAIIPEYAEIDDPPVIVPFWPKKDLVSFLSIVEYVFPPVVKLLSCLPQCSRVTGLASCTSSCSIFS
jgi:hypothetical protein